MTNTEWKKAVRVLDSGRDFTMDDGTEIRKFKGRYGYEYSLWSPGYGTITVDWDLSKIKAIVVN